MHYCKELAKMTATIFGKSYLMWALCAYLDTYPSLYYLAVEFMTFPAASHQGAMEKLQLHNQGAPMFPICVQWVLNVICQCSNS